nr:hypothetical protein [Tanacetum cinerariifolium]
MDQNVDFFGSDQIQTPQYPDVHPSSKEISDKVFQAKGDLMKSIQTFLEEFNYIPFGEKPKILLEAWYKSFTIRHAQPENSNELFQKLLEDLKELAEYKDSLENSSKEIATSEGPPQDSDIHTYQISSVHAIAPILSTKELEYSTSMGYEYPNTTLETKLDEIIKSGVEELVPILSENDVTSDDKRECDMLVCENSPVCNNHSEIFSDSNNDDDISSDEDAFEDIEYVEASFSDPEILSVEEENVVYQEEEEVDLEDISQIQDVVLREKLLSINHNFSPEFKTFCDHTEETRSGSTTTHADDSLSEYDSFCFEIEPDQERLINVVKNDIPDDSSNDPLLEEADLFLASDNSIPPGIKNFGDDSKGDIRFLEELLIDDSIPFPNNESSESDFDNSSFPRPSPEPPDSETNAGEEILVVIDKLECVDPKDEFKDDNYSSFMFVIYPKVFSFLLSAESEDTIFDPGISV